jgi:hypothetical protein
MPKLTLYIVTYDRGTYDLTGKTKPYHWSYFLQPDDTQKASERSGTAYQLHGMPGSFNYQGPEQVPNLAQTGPLNGELEIGEVDSERVERIHEILSKVPIDLDESTSWNCQNWALEGLGGLKREGFVYEDLDAAVVGNWLKEK